MMAKMIIAAGTVLLCLACSSPAVTSRQITISIFHTGNVAGELKRCGCSEKQLGGVARRKTLYDRYRSGNTLLVDSGDVFFGSFEGLEGSPAFYAVKTAAMIRAMNLIGYDGCAVGDYDFAEGADFLLRAVKKANFPFLCANIFKPQGKPVFEPFRVFHRAGLRVGVVALLDDHVVTNQYRNALHNLRISDPFEAAAKVLPGLRKRCDLIVALLHFNLTDPDAFLKANPEIGVAIIGHHVGAGSARKVGNTVIVSDGTLGEKLGRLTLNLDVKGRVLSFVSSMIPVDEGVQVDPGVQKEVDRFQRQVREGRFSEDVSFLPKKKNGPVYVGAGTCAPCHPVIYQRWSNTPHAYAYRSLVEKGEEYDPECVVCHVLGYGTRSGFIDTEKTPGFKNVQCESCHGAGEGHPGRRAMTARVPEDVCRKCHNDKHSPAFDYPAYLSIANQCTLP
ncbi:MAG: hypothetical protein GXP58_06620 [Deltaproteobacteria bacterium]|nr:hypothetical protein [Deltaproteobacteria bacterium]